MIDIEVAIENVYEDPLDKSQDAMIATFKDDKDGVTMKSVEVDVSESEPHIACVTLELGVPDIPLFGASDEEWDEWAEEVIFPFTGIGKEDGESGYFAEITEAPEEYEYAVGQTFEWGV